MLMDFFALKNLLIVALSYKNRLSLTPLSLKNGWRINFRDILRCTFMGRLISRNYIQIKISIAVASNGKGANLHKANCILANLPLINCQTLRRRQKIWRPVLISAKMAYIINFHFIKIVKGFFLFVMDRNPNRP